jgi:hypothetical protein
VGDVLYLLFAAAFVVGVVVLFVWLIRNPPTSRPSSRDLDRDTELGNAEARAWANGGGGTGGGGGDV